METSLALLMLTDEDLKCAELPVSGDEYVKPPSPPPSEHSSQAEEEAEATPEDNPDLRKKKQRKTRAEYVELRNKNVAAYLVKLKDNPPRSFAQYLAGIRSYKENQMRWLKGKNHVAKQEDRHCEEEDVCYSDTSKGTGCSSPRNQARVVQRGFQKKSYQAMADQRKQQLLLGLQQDSREPAVKVLFNHVNFHMLLESNWKLIEMKRLEHILEGISLDCRIGQNGRLVAGDEIQKIYGPMDTKSEHFKILVKAFEDQYTELESLMLEKENKIIDRIREQKIAPDFSGVLAVLREARSSLESRMASMSELKVDQNPYTNPDCLDFWVLPRPKQTIAVYDIRNEEMENFLEFNLPLDKNAMPELLESEDQQKLFVRKGYNAAVFDVGWHFSSEKIYGDISWKGFFIDDAGMFNGSNRKDFTEERWRNILLELRGDLMSFNPFGVESNHFFQHVRTKYRIHKEDSIFGTLFDPNGVYCLSDMFFRQTLAKNKMILFDSLLEGVVITPVEMLLRVWARIRFLIDERPLQLLSIPTLKVIYEACFKQKLFPLRWGFKDAEDFVQNVPKYLPKDCTKDVTIVQKDMKELTEMQAKTSDKNKDSIQKEIDARWAKILENDGDEEEDDHLMQFDEDDLFEELIHEGPWLSEGEVYRLLDD